MQNCEISIEDNILTLKIDLDAEHGFTEHLRSVRVGSTEGNIQLWQDGKPHPKNIRVNCNVFRSLTKDEKKKAEELRRSRW